MNCKDNTKTADEFLRAEVLSKTFTQEAGVDKATEKMLIMSDSLTNTSRLLLLQQAAYQHIYKAAWFKGHIIKGAIILA